MIFVSAFFAVQTFLSKAGISFLLHFPDFHFFCEVYKNEIGVLNFRSLFSHLR